MSHAGVAKTLPHLGDQIHNAFLFVLLQGL